MEKQSIAIANVGPIERLDIPLAPGVVVLRGRNGAGKSQGLEATQAAILGKGKLTPRDGIARGTVDAFGVTVNVARSTRVIGEAEVVSLEGRFDLAQLVDPGLKDAGAADSRRIKSIVSLSGATLKPAAFTELAASPEEFDAIVAESSKAETDPVALAERIKRDFEAAARRAEEDAKTAEAKAAGCREAIAGVDLREESDPQKLADDLEAVSAAAAKLQAERNERLTAIQERTAAQKTLEGVVVPDIETLETQLTEATIEFEAACKNATAAHAALKIAIAAEKAATEKAANLTTSVAIAKDAAESYRLLTKAAQREIPDPPTTGEIESANEEKEFARAAMEAGAVIRKAKEKHAEAQQHVADVAAATAFAERLREAGRGVENILSGLIDFPLLRIRKGRLVTEHPTRGEIPYAEMSDGERWKIALDFAIDHVGEAGLLVIGQEGWEGLDPTNRAMIAEHAAGRGVTILTAECDAGPLRAEALGTGVDIIPIDG